LAILAFSAIKNARASMAKRTGQIDHDPIVRLFGVRLRQLRHSRGMTQSQLAATAQVTVGYIGRLEAGGAAPGIDLVARVATALGTNVAELLPPVESPDTLGVLRTQAKKLFDELLAGADMETLLMLAPLLARLVEALPRRP
jgi:transcriptional regulator with XRE-family HTH domain